MQAEILNQRVLRHPHVVEFKEVFTAGPNQIGIAMEFASGIDTDSSFSTTHNHHVQSDA